MKKIISFIYKYRLLIILLVMLVVLIVIKLVYKNEVSKNNSNGNLVNTTDLLVTVAPTIFNNKTVLTEDVVKIKGLNPEEILGLNKLDYDNFLSGLTEAEKDMLPSRYDISEYVGEETDNFKVEKYDENTKILSVKLKTENKDGDKNSFEEWFSLWVENQRNEINVVWVE